MAFEPMKPNDELRTTNPGSRTIGLIAGGGFLPFMVADGARSAGVEVVCVALGDNADDGLQNHVTHFYQVPLARPGAWIRKLKAHGVSRAIMVGTVAKSKLFTPNRIMHYLPDWRALRTYYWRLRGRDKQTQTLLAALADELASGGITLEDSTMYCKEQLASPGLMTQSKPDTATETDIEFGWPLVQQLAKLDIGQALAVRQRDVIAVEGIEGTENMIERAGQFCKAGNWTLLKTSRPGHDMRFDVPCIGPETIEKMHQNGGTCVVIQAEKTIIIDKQKTLALAEKYNIAVVGK